MRRGGLEGPGIDIKTLVGAAVTPDADRKRLPADHPKYRHGYRWYVIVDGKFYYLRRRDDAVI